MLVQVYLPILAVAAAIVMYLLEIKLLFAPLVMLSVWPFLLFLAVGIVLTLKFNFLVGIAVAALGTLGLMMILDNRGIDATVAGYALFAPVLPLALVQLLASPFNLRKVRAT